MQKGLPTFDSRFLLLAIGLSLAGLVRGGTVDLQLRPSSQTACVGEIVNISLHAISVDGTPDAVSALSVVLNWDPAALELVGLRDDADSPYPWLVSFFPDDREVDRLNNDRFAPGSTPGSFWSEQLCPNHMQCQAPGICNLNQACWDDSQCRPETFCNESLSCFGLFCCDASFCSYTGLPLNDGTLLYQAWSQLFDPPGPAMATPGPDGLLVTKFRFKVLAPGTSQVSIVPSGGPNTFTVVYDSSAPPIELQVLIGQPAASVTAPLCGNAQFCEGTQTCNPATDQCEAGVPPVCPPGADPLCSHGVCDPTADGGAGACIVENYPQGRPCIDGDPKTPIGRCDGMGNCVGPPGCGPCILFMDFEPPYCQVEIADVLKVLDAYEEPVPCTTLASWGLSVAGALFDGGCWRTCTSDSDCMPATFDPQCVNGYCCDLEDVSGVLAVLFAYNDPASPQCPHFCDPGACELSGPQSCCRDKYSVSGGMSESDCFLRGGSYLGDHTTCAMSALPFCP